MPANKIDKHIEIARTTRARHSSMSRKSALKIQAVLGEQYEEVNISVVNSVADLELMVSRQPDLVFLGLKKLPPDLWLSEYLDQRGVNYTGSSKAATKLDFDKQEAKILVKAAGLSTAASFTARPGQHADAGSLPLRFPLFVKPLNIGGGRGVGSDSVVRSYQEFEHKVEAIFDRYGSSSLAERYLTGREFSVAILVDIDSDEPVLMPVEIITAKNSRGDRVLGSAVKHDDDEQVIAIHEPGIKAKISALAEAIYTLLGGRDLARVDIRMDAAGEAHFLEVNFMPAPGSRYFAGACRINEGMDYKGVLYAIAKLGLARGAASP